MTQKRSKERLFDTKKLSYERFIRTADAYAHYLVRAAKVAYHNANDKAFVQETMVGLLSSLVVNEPEKGAAREVLDKFDLCYKLGLPIREAIVTSTRQVANS